MKLLFIGIFLISFLSYSYSQVTVQSDGNLYINPVRGGNITIPSPLTVQNVDVVATTQRLQAKLRRGEHLKFYKINSRTYQQFSGVSAEDAVIFNANGNTYLAIGQLAPANTSVYRWDTVTNQFTFLQNLDTVATDDIDYFQIGSNHYILQGNSATAGLGNVTLWRWASATSFVKQQGFPLAGQLTEIFTMQLCNISNNLFLLFGTKATGGSSSLYQWDGTQFVPASSNPFTFSIISSACVAMGGKNYLFVGRRGSNVTVWDWSGTALIQNTSLTSTAPAQISWQALGNDVYVAVAGNAIVGGSDSTRIWRFRDGAPTLVKTFSRFIQPLLGSNELSLVTVDQQLYLFACDQANANGSPLFKYNPNIDNFDYVDSIKGSSCFAMSYGEFNGKGWVFAGVAGTNSPSLLELITTS